MPRRRNRLLLISGILAACASSVAIAASNDASLSPEAEAVLERMNAARVEDVVAAVVWRQRYAVDREEDADTKHGTLWFSKRAPTPKFKVAFDKKIVRGRRYDMDEQHLFDGRWYVELDNRVKTITRREVRREAGSGDPYKLGEGPFPLPFGQQREDIVAEFVVEFIEPDASKDPDNTDHLKLTPREGSKTGERYGVVHFWVLRNGPSAGLPIQVRAAKLQATGAVDHYLTIRFEKPRLNQGIDDDVFVIASRDGFNEQIEPMPERPAARP